MRLSWLVPALLLMVPSASPAQTQEHPPVDADEVEVYTLALTALLGTADEAGTFYLAERIRGEAGRMHSSHVPEAVSQALAGSDYNIELAELAENGLWQVPRYDLFVMLRKIEFWPGRKIAKFSVDVGSASGKMEEVAFKFLKEDSGWKLIEKGPAENEG